MNRRDFVSFAIVLMVWTTAAVAKDKVGVTLVCTPDGRLTGIMTPRGGAQWDGSEDHSDGVRRLLPDLGSPITLRNGLATPYRCIGSAVYSLQRLGYRRITFINEPPPIQR